MKISKKALYFTDNGRILCGSHLGATAFMTGRDISGQKITKVMPAHHEDWKKVTGGLLPPLACETCTYGRKS